MSSPPVPPDHTSHGQCGCGESTERDALREIEAAKAEIGKADQEIKAGLQDLDKAQHDLEKAESDLEEAKHHKEVGVQVDGETKHVRRGIYVVSAFKKLVGVAADRELDLVQHDGFKPLKDNDEITIEGCEVFVSHVRTGGSS